MDVRFAFFAAWMLASLASAQDPGPFRIEGRVLVPAGCPDGEAIDVVARRGDPQARFLGPVLGATRIDPDGRFELALDPGEPGFYLALDARWLELRPLWIDIRPDEASLEVLLAPALQAALHGHFKGPSGRIDAPALAGSWVWVEGSEPACAEVDADGEFELRAPAAAFEGALFAAPRGYAPLVFPAPRAVADGMVSECALPLVEPASLRGRVVDSGHRGIAGLALSFWRGIETPRPLVIDPWGGVLAVTSSDEGEFEVDGLPPGDLCLRLEDPRWRGHWLHVVGLRPGELRTDIEVMLLHAASLRGSVYDDGGWPVAGARVSAGPREGCGALMVTTTDAEGRFAFDAALPGDYVLGASSESGAARSQGVITLGEGAREQADLVLGRGSELHVLLGDHQAPVRVLVLDALGFLRADQRVWQGELDLELPRGLYRVVAIERDGQRSERRVVLSGRERRPWILRM